MNLFKSFGGQKGDNESAPKARKRRGYFMELEESAETAAASAESSGTPLKVETVAPAPAAPVETAPTPAPAAATAPVPAPAPAPKPEPKPATPATPAMTPAGMTFAPDFLIRPSQGRRMPGPNMSPFMDLARQVNKPRQE